jgi:hypothetical protein
MEAVVLALELAPIVFDAMHLCLTNVLMVPAEINFLTVLLQFLALRAW